MQPPSLCLEKNLDGRYAARAVFLRVKIICGCWTQRRYSIATEASRFPLFSRGEIDRSISRRAISRSRKDPFTWDFRGNFVKFHSRHSARSDFSILAAELPERAIVRKLIRKVKLVHGKIYPVESACPISCTCHTHTYTRARARISKARGASGDFVVRVSFLGKRSLLPLAVAEQSVR
jgi:hypothetical protein